MLAAGRPKSAIAKFLYVSESTLPRRRRAHPACASSLNVWPRILSAPACPRAPWPLWRAKGIATILVKGPASGEFRKGKNK